MTRSTITTVPEDEATDARMTTNSASTRYCPACKRETDHALVIQLATGHVARMWQCLACGRKHE